MKHQLQVSRVSTLFLSVEAVNSSQEDRTKVKQKQSVSRPQAAKHWVGQKVAAL